MGRFKTYIHNWRSISSLANMSRHIGKIVIASLPAIRPVLMACQSKLSCPPRVRTGTCSAERTHTNCIPIHVLSLSGSAWYFDSILEPGQPVADAGLIAKSPARGS